MEGVLGSDFEAAGFKLEGEHYVRGSVVVWVCEDEDRLDRYFWNGERIRTKEQLKEMTINTGIFTPEQAKTEHQTSLRLAKALEAILPANKHVNDFGCGRGEYIRHLHQIGFKVTGYEGTEGMAETVGFDKIKQADLTKPMKLRHGSVICLEVIEHIAPEFEKTAIDNLVSACNGRLILSWAVEGQGGCGHVNERNDDYVIPRIEQEGFVLNERLSEELRTEAGKDLWWFRKSIYVFDKVKR